MTEEKDRPTRTVATAVAAPAVLALAGLGAYIYEQARASAYAAHFGVAFVAADPRQATLPLAIFAVFLTIVLSMAWVVMRPVAVAVPGAVVVAGAWVLVLLGMGVPVADAARLLFAAAVMPIGLRLAWVGVRGAVDGVVPDGGRPLVSGLARRTWEGLGIPGIVLPLLAALAVVIAMARLGTWAGTIEARAKDNFDVIRRDASTVTVIFTRTGDIVERTLDVSLDAEGKPRNVWQPGVVIRPMPETGIEYRTVRLGPTQRSAVEQP